MKINGVFEGGGARGVALAGAAAAALDAGLEFDHVVGTSAGSLVAALLAAGYGSDEMGGVVCSVAWPTLLDPYPETRIPVVGRHIALMLRRGMHRGRELEEVWGRLLAAKGVRTFGDLDTGKLEVIVTDLNHSRGLSLPGGLGEYGIEPATFPVARALHMSAAIPFIFSPVRLHDRTTGEIVHIADGAMAANYPIGMARRQRPVVGFRLVDESGRHRHEPIRGPASLARAVVISGIRARYSLPRVHREAATLIEVPVSHALDFDMTGDQAREVFERGRAAAAAQIDRIVAAILRPGARTR